MKRRQFLTISALSISLSGCIEGTFGGTTENDTPTEKATENDTPTEKATETSTPTNTATETETWSPEGETPECWPAMCEGTQLVQVVVMDDFSGDVVLKAECRGEEYSIQSGESVQIGREEDAETCEISLSIDGEQEFSENIEGHGSLTLTITSNGEVEEQWFFT